MTNNGSANAIWSSTSGVHTLNVRQAVTHLPVVKPQVVTAQIHNGDDDVIEVIADGNKVGPNGGIGLCYRLNGVTQTTCLDRDYVLGTPYDLKVVASGGFVQIFYNGVQVSNDAAAGSTYFFKTGAYVQSNPTKGDAPGAYGEVAIYNVNVTHIQ